MPKPKQKVMTNRVLLLTLNGHAMSADHPPNLLREMRDLSASIFNDLIATTQGRDKPAHPARLDTLKNILAMIAESKR